MPFLGDMLVPWRVVGGFNPFEKHESKMASPSLNVRGEQFQNLRRELPPRSAQVPAYPESARLLKDVNKSSLATPGETNVVTRRWCHVGFVNLHGF